MLCPWWVSPRTLSLLGWTHLFSHHWVIWLPCNLNSPDAWKATIPYITQLSLVVTAEMKFFLPFYVLSRGWKSNLRILIWFFKKFFSVLCIFCSFGVSYSIQLRLVYTVFLKYLMILDFAFRSMNKWLDWLVQAISVGFLWSYKELFIWKALFLSASSA